MNCRRFEWQTIDCADSLALDRAGNKDRHQQFDELKTLALRPA